MEQYQSGSVGFPHKVQGGVVDFGVQTPHTTHSQGPKEIHPPSPLQRGHGSSCICHFFQPLNPLGKVI